MLKIGLVQLSVIEGKTEENRRHVKQLARKYAAEDVDLLCFPELCISGYDYAKARESKKEKDFFAELASECGIAIMAGINDFSDGKYYDAACIWDETGALLGEYKKIHLWEKESLFFQHGEDLCIIPFKSWNIGLLICADLRFFEISTPLKNMGADVIIYPSAWAEGWEDLFHLCARMRAAENQIYTIALNRASGDIRYCGETVLVGPDGNILREIKNDKESYLKIEIKKERIKKIRKELAWESQKLPHIYHKYENYRFAMEENLDIGEKQEVAKWNGISELR